MIVYRKPSIHRANAKPGLLAMSSTVGGAVNMPVPTILLMIKDATSHRVSGRAGKGARGRGEG